MAFDAQAGALACPYCGARKAVETQGEVVEHDLLAGLAETAERGLGLATRTLRCGECGAEVMLEPTATATRCTFCGSPSVVIADAAEEPIRPESLVPFRVDREAAVAAYRGWLSRLWFRPSDLKRQAALQEIAGVYVPFWTYDCTVDSRWTAEAGFFYYTTETYTEIEDGREVTRTREVQHVRWEPAAGSRHDEYDDVLVCASRGLPTALVERLHTFDTSALAPYAPGYLAGFAAERYALDLREGFGKAQTKVETEQERRCAGDVPGDTLRGLSVDNTLSHLTFKHVLLPLWIAVYRYREAIHRFVVNGQTGEVQGTAPWSVAKIAIAVLVVLAALVAFWLARHR
jgi:DNA-directed RNA polymerase subunit RPC12/RpoP